MTQQRTPAPAALIHAAWLEKSLTIGAPEAASELRRLHEVEQQRDELLAALDVAMENLRSHGDNCFVSKHYEGDPGAMCNCGIDGVTDYLISAIARVKGEQ